MPEPKFRPGTRAGKRCSQFFRLCLFQSFAARQVAKAETPPSNSPRSTRSNLPRNILPPEPAESFLRCSPKYQSSQTLPPFFQSAPRTLSRPPNPPENKTSFVLSLEFRRKRHLVSYRARGSQHSRPPWPAPPQSLLPALDAIPT